MRANTVIGTPGFQAPEIINQRNSAGYSYKVDVYSLGCTFRGLLQLVRLSNEVSQALNALIERMVVQEPEARCSVLEVLQALAELKAQTYKGLENEKEF